MCEPHNACEMWTNAQSMCLHSELNSAGLSTNHAWTSAATVTEGFFLQAAQAMSQYAGWEPKEFSEAQLDPQQPTWQPKEFTEGQESTASQAAVADQQQQQQPPQQQSAEAGMPWPQQSQLAQGHDWQQGQTEGQGQGPDWQQQHQWQQQQEQPPGVEQSSEQQQYGQDAAHHSWPPPDQQQVPQWLQHSHSVGDPADAAAAPGATTGEHQLPQQLPQQQQEQPVAPGTDNSDERPQSQLAAGSNAQTGFVYDSASGYWHDAVSGYYYDANTGLYCHPQTQQWYSQDAATGEFTPYVTDQGITGAGANALGEILTCLGPGVDRRCRDDHA